MMIRRGKNTTEDNNVEIRIRVEKAMVVLRAFYIP